MPSYYRRGKPLALTSSVRPRLFIVAEGDSEAYFADTVLEFDKADPAECYVHCIQGIKNLRSFISLLSKQDNFEAIRGLGIFLDSDRNPKGHIASIVSALENAGLSIDEVSSGRYRSKDIAVAVHLSPSLQAEGNIEDLVLKEMQGDSAGKQLIDCVLTLQPSTVPKALAQMYISLRKNDNLCGVGRAFEARVLDPFHGAYAGMISCIRYLQDKAL